ncbi:MAG TPA: hypothetical protein DHW64_12465 [Chitinophagaceae bacterium]|nr:hypothetical protein [Chitinophagaceae bacterium]
MKQVKRIAGLIWMILGPLAVFFLIRTASGEIAAKPSADTWVQWVVFVLVFLPIAFGLSLFGYYAYKGEYDKEV